MFKFSLHRISEKFLHLIFKQEVLRATLRRVAELNDVNDRHQGNIPCLEIFFTIPLPRLRILRDYQRSSEPLPRAQLVPAPPAPDVSSSSLSLFLGGPADSGFAPEESK